MSSPDKDSEDDLVVEIRTERAMMYATEICQEEGLMYGMCTFCKEPLYERCLDCQSQHKSEQCPVVKGVCGHMFHLHCISELKTHQQQNRTTTTTTANTTTAMTSTAPSSSTSSTGAHCILCNAAWSEAKRFT